MNQDSAALIRFEHVSKSYAGQVVLDDVSFNLRRGRSTVLVGPSGAGKSTLLRLLVGLSHADAGDIYVGEQKLDALSPAELLKLRTRFGMLFQDGALFNSTSVLGNVMFPLFHHSKLDADQRRERALQKLAQVGIDASMAARSPTELSGGQRKRVGLARALALDPEIVLFDEPTSGLDPVTSAAIDALILSIAKNSDTSFVVITHDVQSCAAIADDIGLLHQGKLHCFGQRDEILNSTDPLVRQFFDRRADGPLSAAGTAQSTL